MTVDLCMYCEMCMDLCSGDSCWSALQCSHNCVTCDSQLCKPTEKEVESNLVILKR